MRLSIMAFSLYFLLPQGTPCMCASSVLRTNGATTLPQTKNQPYKKFFEKSTDHHRPRSNTAQFLRMQYLLSASEYTHVYSVETPFYALGTPLPFAMNAAQNNKDEQSYTLVIPQQGFYLIDVYIEINRATLLPEENTPCIVANHQIVVNNVLVRENFSPFSANLMRKSNCTAILYLEKNDEVLMRYTLLASTDAGYIYYPGPVELGENTSLFVCRLQAKED